MLQPGLYEQVINNALSNELSEIPEARKSTAPIDAAEASKVLAQYLTDVVQKGLENVQDNGGGIEAQIQLANQIVNTIQNTTQEADFASLGVDQRAEQLLALLRDNDPRLATGKSAKELERPETSIAQSSLFTGAIHEPQMYTELKRKSCLLTVLTCWCPLSNGAVCGLLWTSCASSRRVAANCASSQLPIWGLRM